MNISPLSATPAAGSAPAPATPPAAAPHVGAVRTTIADGLRAAGEGVAHATGMNGLMVDKAYIYPVESAYSTGKLLGLATKKLGPVGKAASFVGNGAGFITAFHGMIIGGMMRTPGVTVNDIAHAIADKIDGKQTLNGDFGAGFAGIIPTPPKK